MSPSCVLCQRLGNSDPDRAFVQATVAKVVKPKPKPKSATATKDNNVKANPGPTSGSKESQDAAMKAKSLQIFKGILEFLVSNLKAKRSGPGSESDKLLSALKAQSDAFKKKEQKAKSPAEKLDIALEKSIMEGFHAPMLASFKDDANKNQLNSQKGVVLKGFEKQLADIKAGKL